MNWNEVKVAFAPPGSTVAISKHETARTTGGSPLQIIEVNGHNSKILASDVQQWFENRRFRKGRSNAPYYTYETDDATALLKAENGFLTYLSLNLLVGLDFKIQLRKWSKLVGQLCEQFQLEIVHPENGLCDGSHFQSVVEMSFAWSCFLERKKHRN